MRVARRTVLASTLSAVAMPAVLRLARADAPQFTLKLQHSFSSVSSAHDKFLAPWARQVESQSGGRIRIDLFPSMQLGGAPAQLFDQARDGVADIVWAMPSMTPGRFPKIEAWELPFVPSSRALVSSKAIDDYGRASLTDEFRDVHPLCFSCSDRGVLHVNRPVRLIEEMKDLRLHVQTRFAGDALKAMGAVGVPMPNGQLPLAITQHVIDGCIDPWDMMPALKLNDLLKTHTEFADYSLSSTTFALVMNKASYDRLPRDLKDVIDANSGQTAAGAAGTMWDLQARAVADSVTQRGDLITTLLPESVAHWRKATEPVINAWIKAIKDQKADGGKLLASAHALLVKYVNEPEPQPPKAPEPEEVSEPSASAEQSQSAPQSSVQANAKANANADAGAVPKADSPGATVQPTGPAAQPSASVAPPAAAPDKPQTSWWRWLFGSKQAAVPVHTPPVAAHAPPPPAPVQAPPVAAHAAPASPLPATPPASALNSAAAPSPVAPLASPPVASPPVVTPAPAPAAAVTPPPMPTPTPTPAPAPVAPMVKPAAKALDIPL
jgi:TRAP-type C4-dicarboxylate transport system substrate-binding protein